MSALKEERLKILELLKDGLITAQEASNLLEALAHANDQPKVSTVTEKKSMFKMLRIKIDTSDGEKIRINIPIEFAKLLKNSKFGNVDLSQYNVNLDQLIEMITNGATGELVSIVDEEGTFIIIVVE